MPNITQAEKDINLNSRRSATNLRNQSQDILQPECQLDQKQLEVPVPELHNHKKNSAVIAPHEKTLYSASSSSDSKNSSKQDLILRAKNDLGVISEEKVPNKLQEAKVDNPKFSYIAPRIDKKPLSESGQFQTGQLSEAEQLKLNQHIKDINRKSDDRFNIMSSESESDQD